MSPLPQHRLSVAGLCLPLRIVAKCENFRLLANFFHDRSRLLRIWILAERNGTRSTTESPAVLWFRHSIHDGKLRSVTSPVHKALFCLSTNRVHYELCVSHRSRLEDFITLLRTAFVSDPKLWFPICFVSFVLIGWSDISERTGCAFGEAEK